jgi:hypothetical protein
VDAISRQKFVVTAQVTPELLRGVAHERADIWLLLLPWDAVKATGTVERVSIPTKPESQTYQPSITVQVFGSAERIDQGEEEPEQMACPSCGTVQPDLDGFGVLYCPACRFCQHASRSNDICDFCGKLITACERCYGSGVLRGMEVGFGGVDDGAECPACEGTGIIAEEL